MGVRTSTARRSAARPPFERAVDDVFGRRGLDFFLPGGAAAAAAFEGGAAGPSSLTASSPSLSPSEAAAAACAAAAAVAAPHTPSSSSTDSRLLGGDSIMVDDFEREPECADSEWLDRERWLGGTDIVEPDPPTGTSRSMIQSTISDSGGTGRSRLAADAGLCGLGGCRPSRERLFLVVDALAGALAVDVVVVARAVIG